MDERYQRAVTHTFVELHKRGLIYRDKRRVNWDPKFQTAISDLEVDNREVDGHMWHFKISARGRCGLQIWSSATRMEKSCSRKSGINISIATTRPETMLGDGAVAVHPNDERYRPILAASARSRSGPRASAPDPDQLPTTIPTRISIGRGEDHRGHDLND